MQSAETDCYSATAMFLAKHLMLDWRLGEKYFMEQLVDGDLGSNNGGMLL